MTVTAQNRIDELEEQNVKDHQRILDLGRNLERIAAATANVALHCKESEAQTEDRFTQDRLHIQRLERVLARILVAHPQVTIASLNLGPASRTADISPEDRAYLYNIDDADEGDASAA